MKNISINKYKTIANIALLLNMTLITSFNANAIEKIPAGWKKGGKNTHEYIVEIDYEDAYLGSKSVVISSLPSNENKKGTVSLTQLTEAKDYAGKRIRISLHLKGEEIDGYTGVYFQVHDKNNKINNRTYSYFSDDKDIMYWTESSVVVDVPEQSSKILYGAYLAGLGKVWLDNVRIEIVSNDTPLTKSE